MPRSRDWNKMLQEKMRDMEIEHLPKRIRYKTRIVFYCKKHGRMESKICNIQKCKISPCIHCAYEQKAVPNKGCDSPKRKDWLLIARKMLPHLEIKKVVTSKRNGRIYHKIHFVCAKHGSGTIDSKTLYGYTAKGMVHGCKKCAYRNRDHPEKLLSKRKEDWLGEIRNAMPGASFEEQCVEKWDDMVSGACILHGEEFSLRASEACSGKKVGCTQCSRLIRIASSYLARHGINHKDWSKECLLQLGKRVKVARMSERVLQAIHKPHSRRSQSTFQDLNQVILSCKGIS